MTITLADGSQYDGELYAMDAWSDFALVRISMPELKPESTQEGNVDDVELDVEDEEWADIRERFTAIPLSPDPAALLEHGDAVFTYGHPMGLMYSLTTGIVSHPSRDGAELDMDGVMDGQLKLVQMNCAGIDRVSIVLLYSPFFCV